MIDHQGVWAKHCCSASCTHDGCGSGEQDREAPELHRRPMEELAELLTAGAASIVPILKPF